MIPKAQHSDPFASQKFRSCSIANLSETIVMPAAIQLDRELCGRTIEIQDIAVQRMLTAKFVARKISVPQMPPKNTLSVGCLLSQQTSALHEKQDFPSPLSSPRKRGEADECVHAGVFASGMWRTIRS